MDKKQFAMNFLILMASTFVLYFLAVGLAKPADQMLRHMNDPCNVPPPGEWLVFVLVAMLATAVWCGLWVAAKRAEKICVDELIKTQSKRKHRRKK